MHFYSVIIYFLCTYSLFLLDLAEQNVGLKSENKDFTFFYKGLYSLSNFNLVYF